MLNTNKSNQKASEKMIKFMLHQEIPQPPDPFSVLTLVPQLQLQQSGSAAAATTAASPNFVLSDTNAITIAVDTNLHIEEFIDKIPASDNIQIVVDNEHLLMQLTKVCRCCLSELDAMDLREIFDNDNCIAEMIMSLATVQVLIDEALPTQICLQCIVQLSRALSFKQQVETADSTLRHYVTQGFMEGMRLDPINGDPEIDESENVNDDNLNDSHSNDDHILEASEQLFGDVDFSDEKILEESANEIEDIANKSDIEIGMEPIQLTSLEPEPIKEEIALTIDGSIVDGHVSVDEQANSKSSSSNRRRYSKRNTATSERVAVPIIAAENLPSLAPPPPPPPPPETDGTRLNPSKWMCFVCKKEFKNLRKLNRHKKIHIDEKPYQCSKCNKGFIERTDLSRHLIRHLQSEHADEAPPKFNCDCCHAGFNVESDLKIHSSIHRIDGKIVCFGCDKEFLTNIQLKRHVRIHFKEKPHTCSVCNKGFPEMGSLTRHFRRHTGEHREKKHVCNLCGKKYYDSYSLNIHNRTHTGEKPWVCTICGKGFIDSRLLHSHVKIHSEDKPFSCKQCNKRFTHQSTLTTHIRTHTGEKPYICSKCGKTFIQSSNLSLHMRVHSGEKPYQCKTCDRSFASSSTLTTHMRIHTGEKPYSCTVCDRSFARYDLTVHMRTHTGEKPYVCSTCPKRFTTSGQLNQHSRVHTGERPFRCDVCDKACSSSTYLKKHKKNHCSGIPNTAVASKRKATVAAESDELITGDIIESKEICLITEQQPSETIYVQYENVCDEEMAGDDPIGGQQSELLTVVNVNDDGGDGGFIVNNNGEYEKDESLAVCDLLENSADTMLDIDEKQNIYEQIDATTIRIKSGQPAIGTVSVLKLSSASRTVINL